MSTTKAEQTSGVLTTGKLQSLFDSELVAGIKNRRDLAAAMKQSGQSISVHGIEGWFKHVDSNYNLSKRSLSDLAPSYAIPKRRWRLIQDLFNLSQTDVNLDDEDFRKSCFHKLSEKTQLAAATNFELKRSASFIGRHKELQSLSDSLKLAAGGSSQVVIVEGPAGIGKSQLLEEFSKSLESISCNNLHSRCAENNAIPLLPIIDCIRVNIDTLTKFSRDSTEKINSIYATFIHSEDDKLNTHKLFLDLADTLLQLSEEKLLVLSLDDLHWADEITCLFLENFCQLLEISPNSRILLIASYRTSNEESKWTEIVKNLKPKPICRTTEIPPFKKASAKQYLKHVSRKEVPSKTLNQFWDITLGNPLYLQQLYRFLESSQQITVTNDLLDLSCNIEEISLPSSVASFYLKTYEKMGKEARTLISYASCISTSFDFHSLSCYFPDITLPDLITIFDEAENSKLIAFINDRFEFCHPLAKHVIYNQLSHSLRAFIHYSIGMELASAKGSIIDYRFIDYANHILKGRIYSNDDQVLSHCRDAANIAYNLTAWNTTIHFAKHALKLNEQLDALNNEDLSYLLYIFALSHEQTGAPKKALSLLETALEITDKERNIDQYGETLALSVKIRGNLQIDKDINLLAIEQLINLSKRKSNNPETETRVEILSVIADNYYQRHRTEDAALYCQQAFDILSTANLPAKESRVHMTAALVSLRTMNIVESEDHFLEALKIAEHIRFAPSIARSLQRLPLHLIYLGKLDSIDQAVNRLKKDGSIIAHSGEHSIAQAAFISGYDLLGNYQLANKFFEDAIELTKMSGYFWAAPNAIMAYCRMQVRLKKFESAEIALKLFHSDAGIFPSTKPFDTITARIAALINIQSSQYKTIIHWQEDFDMPEANNHGYDSALLSGYALTLELALALKNKPQLNICYTALEIAYKKGVRYCVGWTSCLPDLLWQAAIELNFKEAQYWAKETTALRQTAASIAPNTVH